VSKPPYPDLALARVWSAVLLASLGAAFACFELAQIEAERSSSFPIGWVILTVAWALSAITSALNAGFYFRAHIERTKD
jgi:glycerol uptake facilitator-like aquaporin